MRNRHLPSEFNFPAIVGAFCIVFPVATLLLPLQGKAFVSCILLGLGIGIIFYTIQFSIYYVKSVKYPASPLYPLIPKPRELYFFIAAAVVGGFLSTGFAPFPMLQFLGVAIFSGCIGTLAGDMLLDSDKIVNDQNRIAMAHVEELMRQCSDS